MGATICCFRSFCPININIFPPAMTGLYLLFLVWHIFYTYKPENVRKEKESLKKKCCGVDCTTNAFSMQLRLRSWAKVREVWRGRVKHRYTSFCNHLLCSLAWNSSLLWLNFSFLEEVKSTSINLSCCLMKSETCSDFKDTRGGHWEKSFFHFHFFSNYYVSV